MKKSAKSNTKITFDMSLKLKFIINFLLVQLSQLRELQKMGLTESSLVFKADLFTLSKEYFDIIMHIRNTNLFKERTPKLQKLVQEYLKYPKSFNKKNPDLLAIDCAAKLHPHDYAKGKIDKEYLINACLRQQEFCRKIHVKCITFEDCEKSYRKFLIVVKNRKGKITVPSLMEDFMWHSHMRDHQNYVKDMRKNLGFVLNHNDQIPKEDLKKHWDDALTKRNDIYGQQFQQYQIKSK